MTGHYPTLKKRLSGFREWLSARGAEVLEPTNEWEVLRFRSGSVTSVIYVNKVEKLSFVGEAENAHKAYFTGSPWRAMEKTARKTKSTPTCATLRQRDGDKCFFCIQTVSVEDESVEHLGALTQGFPDHISNMVLAHRSCNAEAGHKSIMEKIRMRETAMEKLNQTEGSEE